jgi:hypothetical protein
MKFQRNSLTKWTPRRHQLRRRNAGQWITGQCKVFVNDEYIGDTEEPPTVEMRTVEALGKLIKVPNSLLGDR